MAMHCLGAVDRTLWLPLLPAGSPGVDASSVPFATLMVGSLACTWILDVSQAPSTCAGFPPFVMLQLGRKGGILECLSPFLFISSALLQLHQ